MDTLLLDRTQWDWVVDAQGNVAVASDPYSQTQDVASACRLFQGEAYYDTSIGVPYFGQILGHEQPVQVVKSALSEAALTVPGVVAARVVLSELAGRTLRGQVQVTLADGTTALVGL